MEKLFKNLRHNSFIAGLFADRRKLRSVILVAVVIAASITVSIFNNTGETISIDDAEASSEDTSVPSASIYVDISGEVNRPGVYEFYEETRLFEVIEKAGGLTADADTDSINRAEFIEDGQKIVISSKTVTTDQSDVAGQAEQTSDTSAPGGYTNGKININTASKEQLMTIPGVGEAISARIIEFRSAQQFSTPEDIMNVKGIGTATYEKMKDMICVS